MEPTNIQKPRRQRLALDITLHSNAGRVKSRPTVPNPDIDRNSSANYNQQPQTKTVSIRIGSGQNSQKRPRSRRFIVVRRILIFTLIVVITGVIVTATLNSKSNTVQQPSSNTSSNRPVGNPEYQTVLPAGKSIDELGDWKRVSPPGGDPVFAYLDTIDNISISVSQQPIPKSLKGNAEEQIAELAKKFNATTRIDADGTKVYLGSSAKGPQSAILTKNNLLILIKSQEKIADTSWAKYAKSLR